MSGIAGIFYRDGRPADQRLIALMTDVMAHRGPDDAGVWVDGPVGLGHRMLHTTPESLYERLPLTSRCGNYTITADARIDNRDELIPLLGLNDRPRAHIGDAEVILAAYRRWGERCPEQLLGDFAFAIWDGRKRQLFCARDFMGVRPFHYFASDQVFIIASELRAILSLTAVPRQLNEAKVVEYFVPLLEGTDETSTIYSDILCLPAGCSLHVQHDTIVKRRYRALDTVFELRLPSDDEYAEAFLAVLTQAIRCRLRGGASVGAMLSGGVDSSAIVCIAQRLLAEQRCGRLSTFSASIAAPTECPERRFIAAVLQGTDVDPTIVTTDQLGQYVSPLFEVVQQIDDPFGVAWLTVVLTMYCAAQQHNLRAVLDGVDGDLVASLDEYYPMYLLRRGAVKTMFHELRGAADFYGSPIWRVALDSCVWPITPAAVQRAWIVFRQGYPLALPTSIPLNRAFIERQQIRERVQAEYAHLFRLEQNSRQEHAGQLLASSFTAALDRYSKVAAVFSIEPRHPLLDRRVIDFCLSLPIEQKRQRGWTKAILRRAMAGILPDIVRQRRDRENPSIAYIGTYLAVMSDWLEILFNSTLEEVGPFLQTADIFTIYRQYKHAHTPSDTIAIWSVFQFSMWLRHATL